MGCDISKPAKSFEFRVSIHAPRVGCDVTSVGLPCGLSMFQSTHPVWGATRLWRTTGRHQAVSIHAPRVGCDHLPLICIYFAAFQSTHPVWGATFEVSSARMHDLFQSTHPVWGATATRWCPCSSRGFNPRTPCGVRRSMFILMSCEFRFQSTHPVWGATRRSCIKAHCRGQNLKCCIPDSMSIFIFTIHLYQFLNHDTSRQIRLVDCHFIVIE